MYSYFTVQCTLPLFFSVIFCFCHCAILMHLITRSLSHIFMSRVYCLYKRDSAPRPHTTLLFLLCLVYLHFSVETSSLDLNDSFVVRPIRLALDSFVYCHWYYILATKLPELHQRATTSNTTAKIFTSTCLTKSRQLGIHSLSGGPLKPSFCARPG